MLLWFYITFRCELAYKLNIRYLNGMPNSLLYIMQELIKIVKL